MTKTSSEQSWSAEVPVQSYVCNFWNSHLFSYLIKKLWNSRSVMSNLEESLDSSSDSDEGDLPLIFLRWNLSALSQRFRSKSSKIFRTIVVIVNVLRSLWSQGLVIITGVHVVVIANQWVPTLKVGVVEITTKYLTNFLKACLFFCYSSFHFLFIFI